MRRLLYHWQNIRYSLWFVPALIVAGSIALAVGAIALDARLEPSDLPEWPYMFSANADGARGTLEVIAAATISIAALTFSITILVLSSVAAQYTPRVIRTFMGSTTTKVVLGVFVGIHVYCLIVLRTISSTDPEFVPTVGVVIGMLLALVGVGFLITFIHHIASSIQVSSVVSTLAHDTIASIDTLFPECLGNAPERQRGGPDEDERADWFPIQAGKSGYLQTVDTTRLAHHAAGLDMVLRMEKRVGEFVMAGETVITANSRLADRERATILSTFEIGTHRTVEQDAGVGIRQLADMALRAISPSTNDTTTAAMCIDYLSLIMVRLAGRCLDVEVGSEEVRRHVIVLRTDFGTYLSQSFEQIRQHARDDLAVYLRLLRALEAIARSTSDRSRRMALEHEARLTTEYARTNLHHSDQLAQVEEAWLHFARALHRPLQGAA